MALFDSAISLLLINASPRRDGNTADLLHSATAGLSADLSDRIIYFSLENRTILPCQTCPAPNHQCATCHQVDDFAELARLWQRAEAVLIGAPVYTFGPPAPLFACFERMRALQRHAGRFEHKPVGILAQGGASYAGVEITAQVL